MNRPDPSPLLFRNCHGRLLSRHFGIRAGRPVLCLMLLALLFLVSAPPCAAADAAPALNATGPGNAGVGVYIMEFRKFNVAEGTVEATAYLSLRSAGNFTLADLEILNGHILAQDTITDTPHDRTYRVLMSLDADPDLRRYPFDRHTLDLQIEPRSLDASRLTFTIDDNRTGLDHEANMPGWTYGESGAFVENHSYGPDEEPYSRAVFTTTIQRDGASTVLKFFLPIMLIIVVSLSSLMMRVSSRLGLNASMFLAAVLIHWRIADAIPLVAYATFLDLFMIITYLTLVLVLVSGILILRYTETKEPEKADRVFHWSIRIVPPLAVVLYAILFASILA